MKILLSYEYSELDKSHCFGLVFEESEGYETYVRWVFFHLGEQLSGYSINKKPYSAMLYPFKQKRLIKSYKYANDAKRQAKLIVNRIIKIINKYQK